MQYCMNRTAELKIWTLLSSYCTKWNISKLFAGNRWLFISRISHVFYFYNFHSMTPREQDDAVKKKPWHATASTRSSSRLYFTIKNEWRQIVLFSFTSSWMLILCCCNLLQFCQFSWLKTLLDFLCCFSILPRCRLGHKSKLYCVETSTTIRATCAQCFNSWKNFLVCKSEWLHVYSKITELSLAQKIFSSSVKQIEWKTFSVYLRL